MSFNALLRKQRKNESVFKYLMSLLHLWLGLLSGVVLVVVCFTGSVLVFQEPIENAVNRKVRRVAIGEQRLALDSLLANYNRHFELAAGRISVSSDPEVATHFFAFDRKTGERVSAYFNPYTAALIGTENKALQSFFSFNLRLHRWLLVRGIGKQIVGASTLIFVFMLLSGLFLWWPRKKRELQAAFTLKRKTTFFRRVYELHNVLGFYAMIGLLLLSLSGLYFSYPWVRQMFSGNVQEAPTQKEVVIANRPQGSENRETKRASTKNTRAKETGVKNTSTKNARPKNARPKNARPKNAGVKKGGPKKAGAGQRNSTNPRGSKPSNASGFSLERGLRITQNTYTYPSEVRINLPGQRSKNYVYTKYNTQNLWSAALPDLVEFNPKGKAPTLRPFNSRPWNEKIRALALPFHSGSLMGWPSMILAFLCCLVGTSLPITGFLIWFKRRNV